MKKISMLAAAVLLSLPAVMAAANQTFTIGFILGTAQMRPAAESQWEPLVIGDEITIGDSLSVSSESRVELVDADLHRIHIGENFTNVLCQANVPALASLTSGSSAFSTLLGTRSTMKVTSPVAVAAVRGKAGTEDETAETAEDDVLDAEAQAQVLLDEALNLRSRVDQMIEENNTDAAMAAMDQSRQLAEQALQILENAGVTE